MTGSSLAVVCGLECPAAPVEKVVGGAGVRRSGVDAGTSLAVVCGLD